LAFKPYFASIIHAWSERPYIEAAFIRNAAGGEERFRELKARVDMEWASANKEWEKKADRYTRRDRKVTTESSNTNSLAS
jgi:hypothetical protein